MKLWIGIFLGLILAVLTSKLKINVKYLKKQQNSLAVRFNVNLGLYIFGIIKIVGISFQEDGIHFLFWRFSYFNLKIDRESMKILEDFSILKMLKTLKWKLEKFHLALKIGSEDMMFAVFSVAVIATCLSIFSGKHKKQINLKKYDYHIHPIYHKNALEFDFSTCLSFTCFHLIKALTTSKKSKTTTNSPQNLAFFA